MVTLAEQRKAIGKSIGAGFDSGKSAAKSRRAIGDQIIKDRRGESVVQDLNRLITPEQPRRTLRPVQPVGSVPATKGRANYVPPPVTNTGGGIASPLTEQSYAAREFHDSRYVFSADGVFVWEFKPVRKIVMTDANGETVQQVFASPPNG